MRWQVDAVVMVIVGAEQGNGAVSLNDDSSSDPAVAHNCLLEFRSTPSRNKQCQQGWIAAGSAGGGSRGGLVCGGCSHDADENDEVIKSCGTAFPQQLLGVIRLLLWTLPSQTSEP